MIAGAAVARGAVPAQCAACATSTSSSPPGSSTPIPGFRQPGDRPISRLPNDAAELRQYDALLLVDPDMRALGPQWPEMITNFVGQEGGGLIFVAGELLLAAALRGGRRPSRPAATGRGSCPSSASRACSAPRPRSGSARRTTYTLELTPEGRGDPIFEFNPDPIRNRAILTSLPGMYWSFPVTRARPGATVLARHGDPRMQNQYGRHVLLASQLYGPGRTVFIGFDSTYRWRYLSEDYFDGFWARLVDRVGRNKALGGRFPFQVHLGKSVYRVGDRVAVGVRYTDPAAMAEASELAAELEIAGQPPDPLRFERVPDDPGLLDGHLPGRAGRRLLAADRPGDGGGRRLGHPGLDHDVPRRAAATRDRRALAQPPAAGRPRPAHRRPGLRALARSASSTSAISDARGHPHARDPRRALGRPAALRHHRAGHNRRVDPPEDLPADLIGPRQSGDVTGVWLTVNAIRIIGIRCCAAARPARRLA